MASDLLTRPALGRTGAHAIYPPSRNYVNRVYELTWHHNGRMSESAAFAESMGVNNEEEGVIWYYCWKGLPRRGSCLVKVPDRPGFFDINFFGTFSRSQFVFAFESEIKGSGNCGVAYRKSKDKCVREEKEDVTKLMKRMFQGGNVIWLGNKLSKCIGVYKD